MIVMDVLLLLFCTSFVVAVVMDLMKMLFPFCFGALVLEPPVRGTPIKTDQEIASTVSSSVTHSDKNRGAPGGLARSVG